MTDVSRAAREVARHVQAHEHRCASCNEPKSTDNALCASCASKWGDCA